MKIKTVNAPAAKVAGGTHLAVAALTLAAEVVVLTLVGMLFWWLIPIATAGVVSMTFFQGVAVAAVLGLVRVMMTQQKK